MILLPDDPIIRQIMDNGYPDWMVEDDDDLAD